MQNLENLENLDNDALDHALASTIDEAQLDALFAERSRRIAARQAEIAQAEAAWLAELDAAIAADSETAAAKHANEVAAAFGRALGGAAEIKTFTFGTKVRVGQRWHTVAKDIKVESAIKATNRRGTTATRTLEGNRWIVTIRHSDRTIWKRVRCSTAATSMKIMTSYI